MMARNLRPLGCVLLGLVVVSCCGSGRSGPIVSPAPPPAAMSGDPAVQQALQGTWELVGFETSPEPGQSVTREAQGQLTYDAFANLSVRAALVPGAPGVDPSRNVFLDFVSKASPATSGELAYVGLRNRAGDEEADGRQQEAGHGEPGKRQPQGQRDHGNAERMQQPVRRVLVALGVLRDPLAHRTVTEHEASGVGCGCLRPL